MTDEEFANLCSEVAQLRKQRIQTEFGEIPASIVRLQTLLEEGLSEADCSEVYSLLVNECSKARNDELYIKVLRDRLHSLPNDPMSHAGLAIRLALIEPASRQEAVHVAENALELAKSQNRLVRYCATNMLRIGLILDDYTIINQALRALIDDAGGVREEDTGYEYDFVDSIDVKRVDADLLKRYKTLR